MTNSPLATYTRLTNNKTPMTNKILNRISIHCFVSQTTAKQGVDYFATTDRKSSCNYVVGYDGSIGLSVEEKDRSWCTSSAENDCQAITIEVASEKVDPYKVTDKAYEALLNLVTDICKRNGKTKVIWINDRDKALSYIPAANEILLTVHRWFAKKACPGEYLFSRHKEIASIVTERLNQEEEEMTQEKFNEMMNEYLAEISALPATWEQSAMDWAAETGLMSGNNKNQMMPKRFMTRGELATVLKRFSEMSDK